MWRLHSLAAAGWGWHRTSGTVPATQALARSRSLDQARAAGSAWVCRPPGLMWEPVQTITDHRITDKPTTSHYPSQLCKPNQFIINWVLFLFLQTKGTQLFRHLWKIVRLFILQIAKLLNDIDLCLRGVGVDQRLVVDGPGSLCCQLWGEVAVGSRKTLIVVLWYVVLTGETALCAGGSYLGAQGCWDRRERCKETAHTGREGRKIVSNVNRESASLI